MPHKKRVQIAAAANPATRARDEAFHATKHPVMRSADPGENWTWCYVDEVMSELRYEVQIYCVCGSMTPLVGKVPSVDVKRMIFALGTR